MVKGNGIATDVIMDKSKLQSILTILGEQVPPASRLFLVGGSALTLLGSPRPSLDIDFVGDDVHPNELHRAIMAKAKEMKLQVDIVPIDRFVPLPEGNEQRSIYIGQFANLEIYVIDPYSIALSKLDRGLFTDFDDIIFLIKNDYITLKELEQITNSAISKAGKFDLHPDILAHLQELKSRLK
ncbi:MAG: nucleotidyl transferase AbiEii/AbiGii toxin family protein [Chloroflexi bacterium]|nr:nucleotidyl transferase AbiEii/AbiGii toxin family protein [Chloroflexota bacterium]